MTEASSNDRQAQHVALVGFLLQIASLATLFGVGYWAESDAIGAAARFTAFGLPIWLILFLVFKQVRRVRAEQIESAELRRARQAGADTALFDVEKEELLLEHNRLRWMIRWFLPSVTIIAALYLLLGQFIGWVWSLDNAFKPAVEGGIRRADEPAMMMWFVVGVGFINFLYARYSIALARIPEWRLMRAGASCMAGNALVCLALAIALMAATSVEWAEPMAAYLIRVALIVIGLEFAANFVLDLYRPRQVDFVPRPSFDSRLLGLISEPGGVAKSIAEAINYQFGFEVTSNWFFQLLQRWLFPISVFTILVVVLLSSMLIIDADEEAVVERFGRRVTPRGESMTAGFHLKMPWPIDIVRRTPTKRIRELVIGEATEDEHEHEDNSVLWTEAHEYVPELMLLVAAPQARMTAAPAAEPPAGRVAVAPDTVAKSVPVSLIMVSVPIEYRVKDVSAYLYNYVDPDRLLEAVAYRLLSDYAAGIDIDLLMGPARQRLNNDLRRLLQKRLDELDTGIEIVFVGLRGAHPPSEKKVAAAFQSAISAQTEMQATINAAQGRAQETLTKVAGTEARARELDKAIQVRDRLQSDPTADPDELARAVQAVEDLITGNPDYGIPAPSGRIAAMVAEAEAEAAESIGHWSAQVQAFGTEVAAFTAAPALYKQRRILEVYKNLDQVRKFLVVGDPSNVKIIYDSQQQGGLDRILSEGIENESGRSRR